MVARIITGARPQTETDLDWHGAQRARMTPVIADWGTTAELLVFPADEPVVCGAQFYYCGTIWIVTGHRRDSRIMVAEPARH